MGLSETREPQEIHWSIIIMPITVNWSFRGITNVQTISYKPIIIHNLDNIYYIYTILYIYIVIYIYIILHNYTWILLINSNTHIIFRYLDHTSTWSPALPGRHRPVALHLWRRRWEQPGAAEREPTEGRGKGATARTGLGGVKLWEISPDFDVSFCW